jgi:hypothetical protein
MGEEDLGVATTRTRLKSPLQDPQVAATRTRLKSPLQDPQVATTRPSGRRYPNARRVGSEYASMPDEGIRVGPDAERREEIVLDLEMCHWDDPRLPGAGMLMLGATR